MRRSLYKKKLQFLGQKDSTNQKEKVVSEIDLVFMFRISFKTIQILFDRF